MEKNVSRKEAMMNNNKQIYAWSAKQQAWLQLAKKGNVNACNLLFESMESMLENVHRYSQDGLHPAKFGYSYNFSGRSFEEAYSDIFTTFRDSVRKFDCSQGVPFGAFAVNDLRHRAMDWTRDRQNDRHVVVGQRLGEDGNGETCLLTNADYEAAVNRKYEEQSLDLRDSDTHPVEYCETMDMVAKIRREIIKEGDQKLMDFVTYYLEYAGEKKVMELVALRMGVSRAMAYNYLDKVRSLIMPKFNTAA